MANVFSEIDRGLKIPTLITELAQKGIPTREILWEMFNAFELFGVTGLYDGLQACICCSRDNFMFLECKRNDVKPLEHQMEQKIVDAFVTLNKKQRKKLLQRINISYCQCNTLCPCDKGKGCSKKCACACKRSECCHLCQCGRSCSCCDCHSDKCDCGCFFKRDCIYDNESSDDDCASPNYDTDGAPPSARSYINRTNK